MIYFDGSSPIALIPFLKDPIIKFNAQSLSEGVTVGVVTHFLGIEAERLSTSYTMSAIHSGVPRTSVAITWPSHVQTFIEHYLTDEVLSQA